MATNRFRRRLLGGHAVGVAFGAAVCVACAQASAAQFTNPIAADGADPWVVQNGSGYLYTRTTGGNVTVVSSTSLAGISGGTSKVIWTPPAGWGNVWAPELHQYNNKWYAYFSATSSTTDHRMYVLESNTADPMGSYTFKGKVAATTDNWAIDGTVFDKGGQLYMIWSGWPGGTNGQQNLYIAKMSDPNTIVGERVMISTPTQNWETVGAPPTINEGPEVLVSPDSNTTTVIYSASGSWTDDYALGQLTLTGADPMQAASWTKKTSGPVFAKTAAVFGPGHASFTKTDNNTRDWIVYHSAKYSGAGWNRQVNMQPFSWNPDGTPAFGKPVPPTCPIQTGPVDWVGAINGSANDTVHQYLGPANWVSGTATDQFTNVTLTDDTTLYLNADRTINNWSFTYGSGQHPLTFASDSGSARTINLIGKTSLAIIGGANSVNFGAAGNPLDVNMGATAGSFNISSDDTLVFTGDLKGTAGFTVAGGGAVQLRGLKSFSGTANVLSGTLVLGDSAAGTGAATTQLPANAVVNLATTGALNVLGLSGSTANNETVSQLTGSGTLTSTNASTAAQITINNTAIDTFSGPISGAKLNLVKSGAAELKLTGNGSFGGTAAVKGGTLRVTGTINGPSNLFINAGSVLLDSGSSFVSTSYDSIGQAAGNVGTLAVSGATLTVPGDLNIGDVNCAGTMTITGTSNVSAKTFYVGKFGTASGYVSQSGGSFGTTGGGGDWRIGGGTTFTDSASTGIYNMSGGTFTSGASNLQIGAYGKGTLTQTGGNVECDLFLGIGRFAGAAGLYDMSTGNGSLVANALPQLIVGEQGNGTLLVGGQSSVAAQQLSIAQNAGNGTVTQTGGVVSTTAVIFGKNAAAGGGTYTLAGGVLSTGSISRGPGAGTFNFDGGTLKAVTSSTTFLQGLSFASIKSNGGTIDTNGNAVTIAQAFSGAGKLTKAGQGSLTLTGTNAYLGGTSISAGTLLLNSTGQLSSTGAVSAATSATLEVAAGTHAVGQISGGGSTRVDAGAGLSAVTIRQNSLSVGAGGTVSINFSPAAGTEANSGSDATTLIVRSLDLGPISTAPDGTPTAAATLDLRNSDLIVNAQPGDTIQGMQPFDYVKSVIRAAYDAGSWDLAGLTSSVASSSAGKQSLGVITGQAYLNLYDEGAGALFDGVPVTPAMVLVKYTWAGDANFDGIEDTSDLSHLAGSFNLPASDWLSGDFNYDAVTDTADLSILSGSINNLGHLPEPACGGVFAAGLLVARRRRS